ncbi:MAG: prepilin-type N-terminal cleavage/methylation domain-containing protein [Candidatus Levybacteria bacterium]|nr:prepilin-type N-terminal cleavage/methylation domain-containing protein [Candidatus Levybacteria bacterium]MBI3069819.1 prepilin-type N-terminal cleavage/methylation domain-containing protein [Candidatus Levybacteria bacterium]
MKNSGFTLIELIVVVSILAILSTLGIAAFVNYSRTQALNAAALDVVTMLQTAKSRAQSQIKPGGVCASSPLDGYKVVICPGGCPVRATEYGYELNAVCAGNDELIEERILPRGICFRLCASLSGRPEQSFFFSVLTGGAVFAEDRVIRSVSPLRILIGHRDFIRVSQLKSIRVYSDGRIVW